MKILKNIALTTIFTLVTYFSFAQNNGRKVAVKNVKEVYVMSGIDLVIRQGNQESLTIEGDPSALKEIEVLQNNGQLKIRFKSNQGWKNVFGNREIKAYLNVKAIQSIQATGGSDVESIGTITSSNLTLSASGGSDMSLNVRANNLNASASGGSDLQLVGSAGNLVASASGGSDIKMEKLASNYANLTATGGSDIQASVSKGLTASASGGSDITYIGNPDIKKSSSGSGSVRKKN